MLILQQSRNTTLNIKRQAVQSHAKLTDTPKLTTGHFIELQREKTGEGGFRDDLGEERESQKGREKSSQ